MWFTVLVAAAGCFLLKYLGSSIPKSFLEMPVVKKIVLLLPIALLSALVAVQTAGNHQGLVVDARTPAFLVAIVALRLKASFIVVVLVAATTAAALRHFGLAA
ncbi:MAG: AzlD domain-containing protein [Actinomycetes bacterium]